MQGLSKHWVNTHDFRRKYERKEYQADIMFAAGSRMYRGGLSNISVGGAFIVSRDVNQIDEGELVSISIPFTGGDRYVKRKGRVLWKNDVGFALGFV